MYETDDAAPSGFEVELQAAIDETARLHRELDALEADLARVVNMFLQNAQRGDLALDFLQCIAAPRTLH